MKLIDTFFEASASVQFIMLFLITLSVVSWGVIIWKSSLIYIETLRFKNASHVIQTEKVSDAMELLDDGSIGSAVGRCMKQAMACYSDIKTTEQLSEVKENIVQKSESTLHNYQKSLNKGISVLATIGSTAPYIGLLGTVIGILVVFEGLASASVIDIKAVAPGIGEALVATAIGLATAIPATAGYNMLMKYTTGLVSDLEQLNLQIISSMSMTKITKLSV